jgi:hypothetical protein
MTGVRKFSLYEGLSTPSQILKQLLFTVCLFYRLYLVVMVNHAVPGRGIPALLFIAACVFEEQRLNLSPPPSGID